MVHNHILLDDLTADCRLKWPLPKTIQSFADFKVCILFWIEEVWCEVVLF